MRVEDPVSRRDGLKLGSALILNQNLYFEMASGIDEYVKRGIHLVLGVKF